jgi:hypothetical protein
MPTVWVVINGRQEFSFSIFAAFFARKVNSPDANHLLRVAVLGLCCGHGLAAVGFSGNCRGRGSVAVAETVRPAQVQFSAGHALRLFRRQFLRSARFNYLSRPQR